MANKHAVSQAQVRRAVQALEATGRVVTGLRLHPNGDVSVLCAGAAEAPVSDDDDDGSWAAYDRLLAPANHT